MFGLFRKARRARRGEDHVWASEAARDAGVLRETERLAAGGASVVAVALTATALDDLLGGLGPHAPAACKDLFGQGALRVRLGQPGTVTVALASALPIPAPAAPRPEAEAPASSPPVEFVVFGRHRRREADDGVVAFADDLGPRARVTFHLSFDDPLLSEVMGSVRNLLSTLGVTEDEPIVHGMVTRAIARAQGKASCGP